MSTFHLPITLFDAMAAALAFTACKKDDDEPSTPSGGQTTTPTDPRAAYTGTYLVTDSLWLNGQPYNPPFETYVLSISTGGTSADT